MRTILGFILLQLLASSASAAEMTQSELTRKIDQKISGLSELSYTYTLDYRQAGSNEIKPLIRATCSYKNPNMAKEESVSLYLPDHPKVVRIYRLEGNQYSVYETSSGGSVNKTSHPAQEWADSGVTRESLYVQIKRRIAANTRSSIEYQASRDVYVLTFAAADRATFEIYGDSSSHNETSWLPYSMTVFDSDKNIFVTTRWSGIDVKTHLPDEMFRVPAGANAAAARLDFTEPRDK